MHSITRNIATSLLCFLSLCSYAQKEDKVIVHLKDGKTAEYMMQDVDFVEIQSAESEEGTPAENISGTIATGIDLGLSVLWADHNLGASRPSDYGIRVNSSAEEIEAWGEGWRLPTEEEWMELYEKCSWRWKIIDGISGRLITANGNSIFMPAAGVQFGDEQFVVGSAGMYWTAAEVSLAESKGLYFDSANIYRMDFPSTNNFSVRLVKNK